MIIDYDGKPPQIDRTAWVAPNATVIGDVTIDRHVGVWYLAVIRADAESIRIGEATNIQDGCVLHADPGYPLVLGSRVSVGHRAILHGCHIGNDVLVGMGSIVLNGATVGDGCLIGAGTLIPERVTIPDGSLVLGSPGKVRRAVTQHDRELIRTNALDYMQRLPAHRHATASIAPGR